MEKILIVTTSDEINVDKVTGFLDEDERVVRIDTDKFLGGAFCFSMGENGRMWSLTLDGEEIVPDDVKSVWYRRPRTPDVSVELPAVYEGFVRNESQQFLKFLWSTFSREGIFWLNHPSVLREIEANKLHQASLAARVGLRVPETLVTNDPSAAREFFGRWNGEVVVKTFGGTGIENSAGKPVVVYTSKVPWDFLEMHSSEIRYSPVMFQNYVPKELELRITAVGEQLFTCAIYSQDSSRTKDDWRRYDFGNVRHELYKLPADIKEKLCAFMRASNLAFGAIDMILTPEGEYVFLEVNPSGQWGWIEHLTGMPISRAIAELLANPPR